MRKSLAVLVGVTVVVVGIVWATQSLWSDDDGIEEGKVYRLALTEMCIGVKKLEDKTGLEGRCLHLADLNLPKHMIFVPSKVVPGGNVRFQSDESMPVGTARRTRVPVPESIVDGEIYPAYEYVVWNYHMGVAQPQTFIPTFVIR